MYLLSGRFLEEIEAKPGGDLSRVIINDQIVDEKQDMGYGPASYLDAEQVKQVAAELLEVKDADLFARFKPDVMMERQVYPAIWDQEGAFEFLMDHLDILKAKYQEAAHKNKAMISFLS